MKLKEILERNLAGKGFRGIGALNLLTALRELIASYNKKTETFTLAELRALTSTDEFPETVIMKDTALRNRIYYIDLADTTTPDNGTDCIVTTTGVRYKSVRLASVPTAGTINRLVRFISEGQLGDSVIAQDGSNIGIGTSSPVSLLELSALNGAAILKLTRPTVVDSAISAIGFGTNAGYYIGINASTSGNNNNQQLIFRVGGLQSSPYSVTERMRLTSDGTLALNTTTPNASAILDLTSTTRGLLLPRMTTTQINAIATPADGLMVYNTTLNKVAVRELGVWKVLTSTNM